MGNVGVVLSDKESDTPVSMLGPDPTHAGMPPVTYGRGKTRIDLNGPYGTAVSLCRIGDYWATLYGKDRIHIAMFLADPTNTPEQCYTYFAEFFGDYATLYYGQGTPDPARPFDWRIDFQKKSTPETDYEDATVECLIERYQTARG
jgi:hypothetical protein